MQLLELIGFDTKIDPDFYLLSTDTKGTLSEQELQILLSKRDGLAARTWYKNGINFIDTTNQQIQTYLNENFKTSRNELVSSFYRFVFNTFNED